ncbi:MAG: hypothetical protein AAGC96_08985 [Pseudomonadota bacterium]
MRVEAINAARPTALRTVLNYVTDRAERKRLRNGPSDADIDELVNAFCSGTDGRSGLKSSIDELLSRIEKDADTLIEAIARRLGEMWCSDDCSFATVSIAMMRLHAVCHRISQIQILQTATAKPTGSVLLSTPPREQHTFGLSITEHAFIAAGWKTRVFYPESEAHFDKFMDECVEHAVTFDAVCVSWSNDLLTRSLQRITDAIKGHYPDGGPLLMAGGNSADRHELLLAELGISRVPNCGLAAVTFAEQRLQEPQSCNGATAIAATG